MPKLGEHFFLPLLIGVNDFGILAQRALVDYGATKCVVPKIVNDNTFHLPIKGTDKDVDTGNGKRDFQYVIIPRVIVVEVKVEGATLQIKETGIEVRDVAAWLGDEDEEFVAGMSFLQKFDITMKKGGTIVLES
ncbi:MAG: hypothetical protein ACHQ03_10485 [Candidatus Bathyarchaeia archaeon]